MKNNEFLKVIKESFITFLKTHPRSNKKLIILHGAIANDVKGRLGKSYEIKSYGIENGKEGKTRGRYMEKTVDILISRNSKDLAGIGVKFVMNNYSQNANNYFESMLGETANLRTANKEYFQIFILPEEMPYYNDDGKITKWEKITNHNIEKYVALSRDNVGKYLHAPVKTLLFVIKFPSCDHKKITKKSEYKKFYLNQARRMEIKNATGVSGSFSNAVVLNDYKMFIDKVTHYIKSI